jgi:hypothetical protein
MGHAEFDPAARERRPWNAGRMVGAKRALKPQQVWAIRFTLRIRLAAQVFGVIRGINLFREKTNGAKYR